MVDLSVISVQLVDLVKTALLPLLTLAFGFVAGRRSRSVTIATTLEKDWLNNIAESLAEFIELQYDVIWKRWRFRLLQLSLPLENRDLYSNDGLRYLQDACWEKTFRSDYLKTRLMLLLDQSDVNQSELIRAIERYAAHADLQNDSDDHGDKEKLYGIAAEIGERLRAREKGAIVAAGRRVLEAKRTAIRKTA